MDTIPNVCCNDNVSNCLLITRIVVKALSLVFGSIEGNTHPSERLTCVTISTRNYCYITKYNKNYLTSYNQHISVEILISNFLITKGRGIVIVKTNNKLSVTTRNYKYYILFEGIQSNE